MCCIKLVSMSVTVPAIKLLSTASKSYSNSSQLTPRLEWAIACSALIQFLAVKKHSNSVREDSRKTGCRRVLSFKYPIS